MASTVQRFAILLASAGLCLGAAAQSPADDPHPAALAFGVGYKLDLLNLSSGGLQGGPIATVGHLDLRLTADLDKAWGWTGTTAFFNLLHNHGDRFNRDRVGSLTGVSNIEVPVDTERLFQAWVQKEWADGQYALLVGLYPIDTEFQVLDTAALFVHPSHGATGDLSLTRGPSIFNTSALGMRGKWTSNDQRMYLQAAVLDGMAGDPNQPTGTHVVLAPENGVMGIVEMGWRPAAGEHASEAKFAAGAWGYSARVDDLRDVETNGLPVRRRSAGAYAQAEGKLWQGTEGRTLHGFVRYAMTDGDSTPIRAIVNTGLVVRAPFSARPYDKVGLAYTQALVGDKYRAVQEAAGRPATETESTWEFSYRIKPVKQLAIQPIVQWFRNPGAYRSVREATVLGLRLEVSL